MVAAFVSYRERGQQLQHQQHQQQQKTAAFFTNGVY